MLEMVLGKLERAPFAGQIVVFYAGSDPLDPHAQQLMDWLTECKIAHQAINALEDSRLSALLEAPAARHALPLLSASGRAIGRVTITSLLRNPEAFHHWLSVPQRHKSPQIWCTRQALQELRRQTETDGNCVRLAITAELSHELTLAEPKDEDWIISFEDITLALDALALARANGVVIDWLESNGVAGFVFSNPNDALGVRRVGCEQLLSWLEGDAPPILIDVRSEADFQDARIAGARHLDTNLVEALTALDRSTPLALYCKNGVKSTSAAQRYAELGFIDVVALDGGIEAWKRHFCV